MSAPELLVQREGALLHLQLHRPDKGNALSASLVAALQAALDEAARDADLRLLLLSGAGKHFCTGFDLSNLESETDDTLLARFTRVELMLQSLSRMPCATLALAHGRTMGAGADLFAACSERWIVDDASFAFPGAGFGLVLGTTRLADIVGAAQASRWIEGGEAINAASACASGLVLQQLSSTALPQERDELLKRVSRLDTKTQHAIHAAIGARRRPRGDAGDARDLARLVQSAAHPGLRERIAAYRAAQRPR